MVKFKKEIILDKLFFAYLFLLPLGQIIHGLYLTDLIVVIISVYTLFTQREMWDSKGKFLTLIIIGVFSLLFSLGFFSLPAILLGILYFIRLVSYVLLVFFLKKRFKGEDSKDFLVKNLIIATFAVTLVGFVQYFFIPDLRSLKVFGWDDHYFRLVSTFLDPTFTGIIMLVGLILSAYKYIGTGKRSYLLVGILNLIAILLTYSRSTYLSLIISFVYFFILTRKKILILFPILLLIAIPFLPRPSSEGVKLERTYSIFQKFDDYQKGITVISKSPIFGIGFNNICKEKEILFKESNYLSHSCSGLDNSVLLVISTTGVVGLIFLIHVLSQVKLKSIFAVCLVAIVTHSMFTNTLFYSFVMGIMAILFVVLPKEIKE